jgi:hypothetical protein
MKIFIVIKPSRTFIELHCSVLWHQIVITVLCPDKVIVNNTHISYLKNFSKVTVDVHIKKYENVFYVLNAVQNGTIKNL